MASLEEVGIRIALLGRAEYVAGIREAGKVLDDFGVGNKRAGESAKTMGVATDTQRAAVKALRDSTVAAIDAQREYEKSMLQSAEAAKVAAASEDEAAAARARSAEQQVVASRATRDAALEQMATAKTGVAAEEGLAERTRLASVQKISAWEAFKQSSLGSMAGYKQGVTEGLATEEEAALRTEAAATRKTGAWDNFRTKSGASMDQVKAGSSGVAAAEAGNAAEIEAANERKIASFNRVGDNFGKVGAGIVAVSGVVIGVTVDMAAKFQSSTQRLVSSAGEVEQNLDMVRQGILAMAGQVGFSAEQLSTAMYKVESGGQHGADGLKVLQAAAQGAKTENADLTTVSDALTSAMTDYHAPASSAADITSKLVAATASGKMTFQELAGSMSNILPVASAAHVSLNDILADEASMTIHGESAKQASQNLANAIRNFQAPSQVAQKEFALLGLNAQQVSDTLGTKGLSGTVNLVSDAIRSKMGPGAAEVVIPLQNAFKGLAQPVAALGQRLIEGSISAKDYAKEAKALNPELQGQAMGFETLAKQTHAIGGAQVSGAQAMQTYAGALSKATGGATGMNVALMIGGENAQNTATAFGAVSSASADGAGNVAHWQEIQGTFNQKMSEAKDGFGALAIQIGTIFLPVLTAILGPLGTVAGWLGAHKGAAIALAVVLGGVLAVGIGIVTIALWEMIAPILANPATWIIAAIVVAVGLLAFAVYELITHWAGVASFFTGLWNGILSGLHALGDAWNAVWSAIGSFFSTVWEGIKNGLAALGQAILALPGFLVSLPGRIAEILGEIIGSTVRFAIELPGKLADLGAALGRAGVDAMKSLGAGIIDGWNGTVAWFQSLPTMIRGFFTAAGVWLLTSGKDVLVGLGQGIIDGWNGTIAWFQNLPGAVGRFFINAGTWLLSTGHDILFGLIHGLETAAVDVLSWVTGLVGRFLGGFKQGLGVASPSTVFMQFGRDILQGLLNGLKAMADAVTGFFTMIWSGIKNIAEGNWTGLTSRFSSIWNGVVAVWNKVWDAVSSYFANVWNNIKNNAAAIWNAIASFFTTAWNNEVAFWKNIWQVVSDYFTTVWNNIKNTATTIWNAITSGIAAAWHWLYDNAIKPVGDLIMAALQLVGSVFTWLWHNVIEPVVHGIEALWHFLYDSVIKPVGEFIIGGLRLLGDTFIWLWHNIVDSVVHGIETLWHFLYDNVIKPVIDLIIAAIHLFADAANWLWHNIIDPAWHGIGNIIEATWTNVIHPAFQAVVGGLEWLGRGFQTAVDNIGNIWNKIRGFLSKPINFLINTVWNGGILKAWNMVAGLIALPPVAPLTPIPEFASGGAINAEQGGPLTGPGTGTSDSILARVSAGEFVVREAIASRVPSFLAALNDGQAEAVQAAGGSRDKMGYAAGGPVGADPRVAAGQQFAQSMAGKPYIWGGTGPAGMDCCILGNVLIYGPNGPHRADEIAPGDMVWSYVDNKLEAHEVVASWESKTQPVFKVRTRNRAVVASANHPFKRLVRQAGHTLHREDADWPGIAPLEKDASPRTCSACDGKVRARGLCVRHYEQWKATGVPAAAPSMRAAKACSVSTCTTRTTRRGLCEMHYQAWEAHGDPRVWGTTGESYDVEWARVDELAPGDLLVRPREMPTDSEWTSVLPDGTVVTEDVAWLLGLIVGDGWVGDKSVGLSVYGDERERALRVFSETWGHDARVYSDEDRGVWFHKVTVARALTEMGMRVLGPVKRVPQAVWAWRTGLQEAFLNGYCDADGHRPADQTRHGERSYYSVSWELISETRALHIMLGHAVSNITTYAPPKVLPTIRGKQLKSMRPGYEFTVWPGEGRGESVLRHDHPGVGEWIDAGDFTVDKVLAITDEGVERTYDLTVETSHNFVGDGVIISNSGFTGAVTHVLRGESPFAGRIGTTNTMPWPGFAPGLGGAWALGWNGSHMAGTLSGVNVESSQTPIIYPGAHGADSGQFTGKAFLPQIGGAFAPGGAGGGGGGFLDIIGPAIRAAFELLTNPVIAAIKKLTGPPPPAYNAVPGGIATTARDKLLDFMLSKVPSGSGGSAEIGPLGASHAADIVSATKSKGLHSDAATIAIMTGLAESGLRVLANPNVPASMGIPHEGIGSDHDSVGIFQQRQSWGPTPLLMNPFGSAQLFLNRLGGGPYGDFGSAAQRVQVSAFPGAYSKFQGQAAGLVGPAFASGGIVGAMDGGVFGGARVLGGTISPGMTYMVGESGRELVVPTSPGMVLPAPVTAALADGAGAGGGGRGGRGDVHFNAGAIVVQAAHDPVATANMVADVVADRIARG